MTCVRAGRRWLVHLLAGTMMVLGLVVLAPPAPAAALCKGYSWFDGKHYCPATIESVSANRNGIGQRVWLDQPFVTEVTADTVTVAQTRYRNDCTPTPEHPFCGATVQITFVYLKVPWSGSHRPAYGTRLRLYGATIPGSITPKGYVRTGYCTVELAQSELC